MTRIYKYLHSCVLIETAEGKILFDPGAYSFMEGKVKPESFTELSAVIITHEHADHLDMGALKAILKRNQAIVIGNSGVKAALTKEGIEVLLLEDGETRIEGFVIRAYPADHEKLLKPTPQNTAYLINGKLLHPGDSFDKRLLDIKNVQVLALPVMAPWTRQVDVGEFAKMLRPKIVLPIHDAFVKDFFLSRQYEHYAQYFSELGIEFRPLPPTGEFIEL